MKRRVIFLMILSLVMIYAHKLFAAPSNTMSVSPAAVSGSAITAADENTRNASVQTPYNAHDHTDISSTSNAFTCQSTLTVNGASTLSGDLTSSGSNVTIAGSTVLNGTLSVAGNTSIDGGTFTFNESGADKDAKFEGDTNTNLFYIDASADAIGMGTATPGALLELESSSAQNKHGVLIDDSSTNTSLWIIKSANPSTGNYGLLVESSGTQVGSGLVKFIHEDEASTATLATFENDGQGAGIYLKQDGVSASGSPSLVVTSAATQNAESLALFELTGASSDQYLIELNNDGSGDDINSDSTAKLTASGTWTNAVSLRVEKENIKDLTISGYITKLKNLKLYSYQKKREVYGAKKEKIKSGKKVQEYDTIKIRPNAPVYIGYILDDISTPDELISRDMVTNEINGISPADGVSFLLAVTKEMVQRLETLEQRVFDLENR